MRVPLVIEKLPPQNPAPHAKNPQLSNRGGEKPSLGALVAKSKALNCLQR